MGLTFKENVNDTRNSKITDTIEILKEWGVQINGYDPLVSKEVIEQEFGIKNELAEGYFDGIIISSPHDRFVEMPKEDFLRLCKNDPFIIDVTGKFRDKFEGVEYFSL